MSKPASNDSKISQPPVKSLYCLEPEELLSWSLYAQQASDLVKHHEPVVRCRICRSAMYSRNILRHFVCFHHEWFNVNVPREQYSESTALGRTKWLKAGDVGETSVKEQITQHVASTDLNTTGWKHFPNKTKLDAERELK